jgi:AcrR family transcriptional regulator
VAEIASRARSSVGAFYARFHDKEALLRCLHQRFCDEACATADEALDADRWAGASIAEVCAEVVPFLVRIYHERRGLLRAFIVRGGLDDSFLEAGARLSRHVAARLRALLLARRHEISHPDPALAIDFGLRLMLHLLDLHTVFGNVQPTLSALTQDELSCELIRAYLNYLGVTVPNLD